MFALNRNPRLFRLCLKSVGNRRTEARLDVEPFPPLTRAGSARSKREAPPPTHASRDKAPSGVAHQTAGARSSTAADRDITDFV